MAMQVTADYPARVSVMQRQSVAEELPATNNECGVNRCLVLLKNTLARRIHCHGGG